MISKKIKTELFKKYKKLTKLWIFSKKNMSNKIFNQKTCSLSLFYHLSFYFFSS